MTVAWLEQKAADVPASDYWLSAGDRERTGRFRFEKRRSDWLLGRWTAKLAVSKWLAVPDLHSIEIRPAPSGAPRVFVAGEPAPVALSLSHSNGAALCAVAAPGAWLGCDIESVEPRSAAFAEDYFTAAERRSLGDCLLPAAWSAKESALKALGIGLGVDMRRLSVEIIAGHNWAPLAVRYAHLRTLRGWWLESKGLVRTIVCAPAPSPPELLL